jgi:hypothetical protein
MSCSYRDAKSRLFLGKNEIRQLLYLVKKLSNKKLLNYQKIMAFKRFGFRSCVFCIPKVIAKTLIFNNGTESTVNRALGGSTYPG